MLNLVSLLVSAVIVIWLTTRVIIIYNTTTGTQRVPGSSPGAPTTSRQSESFSRVQLSRRQNLDRTRKILSEFQPHHERAVVGCKPIGLIGHARLDATSRDQLCE
jgi:hypothetical protein